MYRESSLDVASTTLRFDAAEATWAYELPDGGLRPAAQVVRNFAGPWSRAWTRDTRN